MEYSNAFVCLMGIGTVFFGLICIILLIVLMSRLCRRGQKRISASPAESPVPAAGEPNRQEMIAAVSAALAESLGTDITGIRILSVKKL
jgi:sodium pump decarboxylase gamma subunit